MPPLSEQEMNAHLAEESRVRNLQSHGSFKEGLLIHPLVSAGAGAVPQNPLWECGGVLQAAEHTFSGCRNGYKVDR